MSAASETSAGLTYVTANARVSGQVFVGDYQLIASLGRGGMAEVFLAVRSGMAGFHKLVVIKRLRRDLRKQPYRNRYRALLLDEARLAARLSHPNIVQTFEVGDADGVPFLAMEYLDGQPLSRVLARVWQARAGFAVEFALQIVIDTLSGLAYAHELTDFDGKPLHIIHRDISPDNLFWTYDGAIKLLDFGVAKFALNTTDTDTGVVKGKLPYMAPEQARGKAIDHRVDLFAVGIVMWELIAGRHLLYAPSTAVSVERLLHAELPCLSQVVPDVDPEIARICRRALERDLAARYATASDMRTDLERVQASHASRRAELAAFIQELFRDERASVAHHIRDALASCGAPIPLGSPRPPSASSASESRDPHTTSASQRWIAVLRRRAVLALVSTMVIAVAVVVWRSSGDDRPVERASAPPAPVVAAPDDAPPALVLCGSNTMGAELAPALVEAFFDRKGAGAVTRGSVSGHARLSARLSGAPLVIEIRAAGSATAFTELSSRGCDIGMASRPINDKERAALSAAGFGDMTSPATEHVIGLDGIAVIVHPNNPLAALDRDQLHAIFTGHVTEWSQVGGAAGPITLVARDDNSGTFDTFMDLVLRGEPLDPAARRVADSRALSDQVAGDPSAIGFIGLAYVRSARAVPVGEPGMVARLATSFTITTEGYLLSRRLYLYTLPRPRTKLATELVSFALSPHGQAVVRDAGFVDLSVSLRDGEPCDARCPASYTALTAHAQRLSLDFRFRTGSEALDSRGSRDLDRVVQFLRGYPDAKLLLLGFSDADGSAITNLTLSQRRAAVIARELELRGVRAASIEGLGAAMPVAPNTSESDRQRNRRVEVWVEGAR